MILGLKVDVDTYVGLEQGVPNLMALLRERGIRASFFVAMGPDNSGKAIRRLFTQRGFLGKMLRTRAGKMYGTRTLLYGTLLPAPQIAASFPKTLVQLTEHGHELGLHGYDHVQWHDALRRFDRQQTATVFARGAEVYRSLLGKEPTCSAAPGWQCTERSLEVQDDYGFLYHSDTRGHCPYFPQGANRVFRTLEIPTTLPTLDEILGREGVPQNDLIGYYLSLLKEDPPNVYTLHAEFEGMGKLDWFADFLEALQAKGVRLGKLEEIAGERLENRQAVPIDTMSFGTLPGRAGEVAVQGMRDE